MSELVPAPPDMAREHRKAYGLIHWSDRGSRRTSMVFKGDRCEKMSVWL